MSTEEENTPVPNWLLKLEEQREKRLKARLGHETGAGAPCQNCGDKCPGLDLHFWRKICKLCKCGKEDHDICDDDVFGFIQFQLLGNKPTKSKGILLKGRKDEVILEWTPKGSSNDVKKYLDELPSNMVPVKGSEAAKIRKQRLQKQLPAHDIDATLCHALTPDEIKELEEYVAHIRKHCVGQGKIVRLPNFKSFQHKITNPNAQFLTQFPPAQLASSQTVFLQSSDLANNLHNLSLRDQSLSSTSNRPCSLNNQIPAEQIVTNVQEQIPTATGKTRDLIYPTSHGESGFNSDHVGNLKNTVEYPNYAPQSLHQIVDNQNPVSASGKVSDINYPVDHDSLSLHSQYPNAPINSSVYEQNLSQVMNPKLVQYPLTTSNVEKHQEQFENPNFEMNNANIERVLNPHLNYSTSFISPIEQHQIPTSLGQLKDLKYPSNVLTTGDKMRNSNLPYDQNYPDNLMINNANVDKISHSPLHYNPNYIKPVEQHQLPTQVGQPVDLKYGVNQAAGHDSNFLYPGSKELGDQNKVPSKFSQNNPTSSDPTQGFNYPHSNDNKVPSKFSQNSSDPAHGLNYSHPNDSKVPSKFSQNSSDPVQGLSYPQANQSKVPSKPQSVDSKFPDSGQYNPSQRDSLEKGPVGQFLPGNELRSQDFKHRPQMPVLQAQSAINPFESQQNLQSVGYIRDIDYPLVPNSEMSPLVPSSDPFDIANSNSVVIPSCHECKKFFEDGSIAISAERTTNLWHASCFNCHTCKQPLADLLYFYHKDTDNIYCGRDYAILKGIPRCAACDELIFVREYCLAEDSTFHVKHFCCFECDEPLAGKQYVMENNQPVCVDCFENVKAEKCNDCGYVIRPEQQGVSLQDLHWHADTCFVCKLCRKSLLGNKMLLKNNNLFCSDICYKTY